MRDVIWILSLSSARLSVLIILCFITLKWLGLRLTARVKYTIWRILAVLAVIPMNVESALIPVTPSSLSSAGAGDMVFPAAPAAPSHSVDIWQILFVLWVAGAIGFFTYHFQKNRLALSLIRRWCVSDIPGEAVFAYCKRELRLSANVRLYRSKAASSPMAFGLWRPTVVIPCRTYTDEELMLVFRHELTHIARKDALFKWIALLGASIHWYNPFIYLLLRQLNDACELSCDEKMMVLCDRQQQLLYGRLLLQSAVKSTNAFGLYTSMAAKQSTLKIRLETVIGGRMRRNPALCAAFLAVFITAALLMPCTIGYAKTAPRHNAPLPSEQREVTLITQKPPQDITGTTVSVTTSALAQRGTRDTIRSTARRETTVLITTTTATTATVTDSTIVTSLAYTTQPKQNSRFTTTQTASDTSLATYAATNPTKSSPAYTAPVTVVTTTTTTTATHLNLAP